MLELEFVPVTSRAVCTTLGLYDPGEYRRQVILGALNDRRWLPMLTRGAHLTVPGTGRSTTTIVEALTVAMTGQQVAVVAPTYKRLHLLHQTLREYGRCLQVEMTRIELFVEAAAENLMPGRIVLYDAT